MTSNNSSRILIYLCALVSLLPFILFGIYGFLINVDIYGKIDSLLFCIYYFISLIFIATFPKAIFSSYIFVSFFLIFVLSKASHEYYLFYDTYISFDHLTLFEEFLLALKNFSSWLTFVTIIFTLAIIVALHIYVISPLKKPSIKSSIVVTGFLLLVTLPFYNFHTDRYLVAQVSQSSENPSYNYSFENPIMFFIRSFPWSDSTTVYKENAKRATLARAIEKNAISQLPESYLPKNYASLLLGYPEHKPVTPYLTPFEYAPVTPSNVLNSSAFKKQKNVLIVVLESFRSYEFESNKIIGKNLDTIAEKSIVFDQAYSIARATIKSEQAILCSSLDTNLKTPYSVSQGRYSGKCLPKIFKDLGYETTWFHGNTKDFYNRTIFHPTLGFDTIYSKDEIQQTDKQVNDIGWGIPDPNVYQFALNKLKNKSSPFFAEILTVSSHQPFNWDYGEFKFPNEINFQSDDVYKNYLKALYYADDALGKFWNEFISSPLKDNTIVIFTGDHGVPFYPNHIENEVDKFNILFKVPLMIYHPEIGHRKSSFQSSHLDIAPTLLSLLKIKEENSFIGRATLGSHKTLARRPIFHMNKDGYGFRLGKTKCIPKMQQCTIKKLCYKDERFMCDLEKETDILQIQQSSNLMEYMKLLTETHYAE